VFFCGTSGCIGMFFHSPPSGETLPRKVCMAILVLVSMDWFESVEYQNKWPFQEPKLEVPTIYKAYIRAM
jgi:hypothetical protein